ncbi:MAG: glycosyltransferase [Bacillota bacterium]|jgi:glycosyltransferase involved in cell wall biosynthesis
MIKVLHIISDTNIGGAGRYLLTFLEYYDRSRLQVTVMCPPGSQLIDRCQALGVPVTGSPFLTADSSFAGNNLLGLWRELRKLTKHQQLDVVHTHASFVGRLAARLAGVPRIVYTKHRLDWAAPKTGWKKWVVVALNRLTCDRVIAISQAVKETLIQEGLPGKRIELIYNGIDVQEFRSKAAVAKEVTNSPKAEIENYIEGCCDIPVKEEGNNFLKVRRHNHQCSQARSGSPCIIQANRKGNHGYSLRDGDRNLDSNRTNKANQGPFNPEVRPPIVGIIARLEPEKGHRYFLEAAAQICRRFNAYDRSGSGEGYPNTSSLQPKCPGTGQTVPDSIDPTGVDKSPEESKVLSVPSRDVILPRDVTPRHTSSSDPASFSESAETTKHHRVPAPDVAPVFLIVGDGSLAGELKELAQHLQIADRVIFTGFREDVPQLMAAMDVVVVPSLSEAFGLSLIEAMCLGKPCVASAVGGITEIAEDGRTALLVPPGDGAAIAEKVTWLLQNKEKAAALGARAAAEVEQRFSARVMVEKMTNLYKTLN